jgi:hypothetical protein
MRERVSSVGCPYLQSNGVAIGPEAQKLLVQTTTNGKTDTIASLNVIQPPPPHKPEPITVSNLSFVVEKLGGFSCSNCGNIYITLNHAALASTIGTYETLVNEPLLRMPLVPGKVRLVDLSEATLDYCQYPRHNINFNWELSGDRSDAPNGHGGFQVVFDAVVLNDETPCLQWQLPRLPGPYFTGEAEAQEVEIHKRLTATGGAPVKLGF